MPFKVATYRLTPSHVFAYCACMHVSVCVCMHLSVYASMHVLVLAALYCGRLLSIPDFIIC